MIIFKGLAAPEQRILYWFFTLVEKISLTHYSAKLHH